MKNLHITCDNAKQRQDVMDVLNNAGFRTAGDLLPCKYDIQTTATAYANTSIRADNRPKITYTQFMEKYAVNKLTSKINEAMTKLKISKAELSRRIGKHRNYLGSIQQAGATTKKQNEIITALDEVIAGTFKTDSEVIAELTQRLTEAQDMVQHNANCAHNYLNQWKHEQKLKAKADELNAGLINANKELMQESDALFDSNKELNAELNTMRKISQDRAETIERINDDLTYIKEENDKLSEMASNQQDINLKLNAELMESYAGKANEISKLNKSLSTHKMITWIMFVYISIYISFTQWWM